MERWKKKWQQSADTLRRSVGSTDRRERTPATDEGQSPLWHRILLLVGAGLILGILVTPHYIVLPVNYQVGDVADHDIKAAHDFLVTDEAATDKKREEAARNSVAVYDLDEERVQNLRERLHDAFTMMRSLFEQPAETSAVKPATSAEGLRGIHKSAKQLAQEKRKDFEAKIGTTVSDDDYGVMVRQTFYTSI